MSCASKEGLQAEVKLFWCPPEAAAAAVVSVNATAAVEEEAVSWIESNLCNSLLSFAGTKFFGKFLAVATAVATILSGSTLEAVLAATAARSLRIEVRSSFTLLAATILLHSIEGLGDEGLALLCKSGR